MRPTAPLPATARSVSAMMLREMATSYGRSPGGYVWAVLQPVAVIALLSVAFSTVFAAPPLGDSFPLFFASAYLPYMLFQDIGSKLSRAVPFSRPLLAYPAVSFVDVILARFALNLLTHAVVFGLVIGGILLLLDPRAEPDPAGMVAALALAAALALGVGTLNCYLTLAFPIWDRVWTIATRPLFVVSGIFFLYEDVPTGLREALWYNPLIHVAGQMRAALFAPYDAAYAAPLYVLGIALLTFTAGLALLRRSYGALLHG